MRRLPSLRTVALVVAMASAVVSPAGAAIRPIPPPYIQLDDCGAPLLDAPAGGSASCWTSGATSVHGNPQGRWLTLAVQTGAAHAQLTCYTYDGGQVTATLSVAAPFNDSTYLDATNTYYCYLEVDADFHDTTAIAVDRTSGPLTVTRSATLSTGNCAASPGGLCQPNNPNQPGGSNTDPAINATLVLADDGTTLTGYGVGSGFVPTGSYVSLLYLNPNVQTCSRFPANQTPTTANTAVADNDFASMYLGMWSVDDSGFGSFQVFPGKPTPVGGPSLGGFAAYGTVSVRRVLGGVFDGQTIPIVNNVTGGKDVPPNIFALRACGSLS